MVMAVCLAALDGRVIGQTRQQQEALQGALRDQIIINTQRLNTIERMLDNIQAGSAPVRIGVIETRMTEHEHQLDALRQIVYGSLAFAFIQFAALLGFALKVWLNWMNKVGKINAL